MSAGGVIECKLKHQATAALSSTEAEFTAAAEAGKTISHTRSILKELGCEQCCPTTLHINNQGALFMANAEQPTRRTRHMETKTFATQQWIREENMLLKAIGTQNNAADHFSKALGQTKFYEQTDLPMGRTKPKKNSSL